jgi:hypothetical protein
MRSEGDDRGVTVSDHKPGQDDVKAVFEIDQDDGWTLPTLTRTSGAARFTALILTSAPIERHGRVVIRPMPVGRWALAAARGCG